MTGANKGIGYEIAAGLGILGWRVGVGARDDQRREAAVATLRAAGADAFGVPLDVTDDASVAAAARLIEERAGRLDVLVNNAGITGGAPQMPTTVDPATVREAVETNVLGVIRVTNALLPLLRRAETCGSRWPVHFSAWGRRTSWTSSRPDPRVRYCRRLSVGPVEASLARRQCGE